MTFLHEALFFCDKPFNHNKSPTYGCKHIAVAAFHLNPFLEHEILNYSNWKSFLTTILILVKMADSSLKG